MNAEASSSARARPARPSHRPGLPSKLHGDRCTARLVRRILANLLRRGFGKHKIHLYRGAMELLCEIVHARSRRLASASVRHALGVHGLRSKRRTVQVSHVLRAHRDAATGHLLVL